MTRWCLPCWSTPLRYAAADGSAYSSKVCECDGCSCIWVRAFLGQTAQAGTACQKEHTSLGACTGGSGACKTAFEQHSRRAGLEAQMCLPHHLGSPVTLRLVLLLMLVEHMDHVAALHEL